MRQQVLIQAAIAALNDPQPVKLGTASGMAARFEDPTACESAHVIILDDGDMHRVLLEDGPLLVDLAGIIASDLADGGMGGQVQALAAAFKAHSILAAAIAPYREHLTTIAETHNRDITAAPARVAS